MDIIISISEIIQSMVCSDIFRLVVIPSLVAWVTSRLAFRNELISSYREKRAVAYNEVICILDDFRGEPSLTLDSSFLLRLVRVSNRVRVYGSKRVINAMETFSSKCNERYQKNEEELNSIKKKHIMELEHTDEVTREIEFGSYCDIDENWLIELLDEEYVRNTPSRKEALEMVRPVLDAIRQSESSVRYFFFR